MNEPLNPSQLSTTQELVLDKFPYPVSILYSDVLASVNPQQNILRLIQAFDYLVRLCSISLISQYQKIDSDSIKNADIEKLLSSKLPNATLGTWVNILFSLTKFYYEHPEIELFIPELKNLYSSDSNSRKVIDQVVIFRNEFVHRMSPVDEKGWEAKFDQLHQLVKNVFETLEFISRYKLILLMNDEKVHRRDNKITLEVLDENPNILLGAIYIKNSKNDLLELSPLAIGIQTENSLVDFAIFDRLSSSSINYISFLRRESVRVEQESLLAQLRTIIPKEKHIRKPKVFISYAKQDVDFSNQILEFFSSIKCEVWIDKINLLPGQDWEYEIKRAIDESDYFVACLSSKSVSKIGFVQKELKLALSVLEKFPEGKVFIIPIRLDDCQIPSQLAKYHCVDWYVENTKELLRKTVAQ